RVARRGFAVPRPNPIAPQASARRTQAAVTEPRSIIDTGNVAMPRRKPGGASELIPARPTLAAVRAAARACQACDLWTRGTQTVFGEGTRRAELMIVGEQPGNEEDLSGRPFVGPAGKV